MTTLTYPYYRCDIGSDSYSHATIEAARQLASKATMCPSSAVCVVWFVRYEDSASPIEIWHEGLMYQHIEPEDEGV